MIYPGVLWWVLRRMVGRGECGSHIKIILTFDFSFFSVFAKATFGPSSSTEGGDREVERGEGEGEVVGEVGG